MFFHSNQKANGSKANNASTSKGYTSVKQQQQQQLKQNQKSSASPIPSPRLTNNSSVNNNNNSTSKNNNSVRFAGESSSKCSSSSSNGSGTGSILKTSSVKRTSPTNTHPAPRSFQYESFHVFDWDEYLQVYFSFIQNSGPFINTFDFPRKNQ